MKLHKDIILYWIKKKYPYAKYISAQLKENCKLDFPMFPSSAEKMQGHLVVINELASTHFVNRSKDVLFVLAGKESPDDLRNDHILLGREEEIGKLFNYILEIYHRFQNWENDLEQAVHEYYSYEAIIRSCDPLVSGSIAMTDAQFHYVAYSKHWAMQNGFEDRYVSDKRNQPLEVINQHLSTPGFKELEQLRTVFQFSSVENCLHKNIFDADTYIARLAIPCEKDPLTNAYHGQILSIIAQYIEQLYASLGTFYRSRTANNRLNLLFHSLLEGKEVDHSELTAMMKNRNNAPGDRYCLVQFRTTVEVTKDLLGRPLTEHLQDTWPYSIGFQFGEKNLLLVNLTKYEKKENTSFRQDLAYFLRESMLLAGLSRPFKDIHFMRAALEQTQIAFELGLRFDPMYWYFKFDDYASWYLLHNGQRDFLPEQICSADLVYLLEYDRENGTELYSTLEAYIKAQYNSVVAAEQLHISRSAFVKRMKRLQEVRPVDLDHFESRLYLALSFQLFQEWISASGSQI